VDSNFLVFINKFSDSINSTIIENCDVIRDLGVEIDNKLKFDVHINSIVKKAYNRVSLIYRRFVTSDTRILQKAYITYVRPILDYCSHVWSPMYIKHIDAIEKVQKRFTKRLPRMQDLSYLERLAILGWDSLELRRLKSDLCLYYNIYSHHSSIDRCEYFQLNPCLRITRSTNECNFIKPFCHCDVLQNSFFIRQIDAWNTLPVELRCINSLAGFKRRINSVNFITFLKGSAYKAQQVV